MPLSDPIEEAAKTYEGWRELAWTVKNMAATLDRMESKVDRQLETDISALKLENALMKKDIEALKKEGEIKTSDNRWIIGTLFGLLGFIGMVASLLWNVFRPIK